MVQSQRVRESAGLRESESIVSPMWICRQFSQARIGKTISRPIASSSRREPEIATATQHHNHQHQNHQHRQDHRHDQDRCVSHIAAGPEGSLPTGTQTWLSHPDNAEPAPSAEHTEVVFSVALLVREPRSFSPEALDLTKLRRAGDRGGG